MALLLGDPLQHGFRLSLWHPFENALGAHVVTGLVDLPFRPPVLIMNLSHVVVVSPMP